MVLPLAAAGQTPDRNAADRELAGSGGKGPAGRVPVRGESALRTVRSESGPRLVRRGWGTGAGLALSVWLVLAALSVTAVADDPQPPAASAVAEAGAGDASEAGDDWPGRFQKAVVIRFEGDIHPLSEHYLYRKLDEARGLGADLVIVELDSPGGHLESSLNIAEKLRFLDWAETVAYIPSEAYSGAAIAALGCDQILMGPDAQFGDAAPIFQGRDFQFRHAPEKIRSVLVSQVRDLAESRGRPPALAQAMVDMDITVYRVTHNETGQVRFMSQEEIAAADDAQQWTQGPPVLETQGKLFLTINGRRAVELQMADANIGSRDELQTHFQLANPPVVLKHGAIDTIVYILNLPLVTGLLLVVGLVAFYFEFSSPGISVGGLIGGLCFTMFFWSRFLGGTSTWLEILLFLAGVIFLAVELFVLPGFGVAGITGILLMGIAVLMASQDFLLPSTPRQMSTLAVSLGVLVGSGITFLIAISLLSRHLPSIPLLNRLILAPPSELAADDAVLAADSKTPPGALAGSNLAVREGDWGVAVSPLRPAGKARFGDDYLDVVADGVFVDQARQVRIVRIQGNRIVVREIEGDVAG
ncbi:MAG: peptidase [Pirellulaceae bacterium]|nr:peptidase [Pirellulaceae bacterium]